MTTLESLPNQDPLLGKLRSLSSSTPPVAGSSKAPTSFDCSTVLGKQTKYKILRTLGEGGMGTVYLAEHSVMGRQVAIKAIREDYVANPEAVIRFQNEVRAAAKLSHRNIVTAHDAEQSDGHHFLVMEYVPGESLTEVVRRKGRLGITHACNYIFQIAQGLKHAHKLKMVHRDIKPSNLMRTPEGIVKILDFGLARMSEVHPEANDITSTGTMMGTVDFVSPEQARDAKSADIRSDLYSLGCTFFFLLTGKAPFQASTKVDKILAHVSKPFPDVTRFRPDIDSKVAAILTKLTQKQPEDRYQSPTELIQDLRPFSRPGSTTKANTQATAKHQVDAQSIAASSSKSQPIQAVPQVGTANPASETRVDFASPTPPTNQDPEVSRIDRRLWIAGSSLLVLCLLASIASYVIPGFFTSDSNSNASDTLGNPNESNANSSSSNPTKAPTVLMVVSPSKFWYSDYGPIKSALEKHNIRVLTSSNQRGLAKFDRNDTHPAPEDLNIEMDLRQFYNGYQQGDIQAIVFMGNSTREFLLNDEARNAMRTLLKKLGRDNVWLASIGKGMSIPIELDLYNNVTISASSWVSETGLANPTDKSDVVVDELNRAITGSSWDVAAEFGEKLAELLLADGQ